MQPTLAQVLTTLAHELRTPVAVSQGYIKLWLDGRLGPPEEQQRAMQQTRDAMARLAGLCAETGRLATLAETVDPPQPPRVAVSRLIDALQATPELQGVPWLGSCPASIGIATWHLTDLATAMATTIHAVLAAARQRPTAIEIGMLGDEVFSLRAGVSDELAQLGEGPGTAGAAPFDMMRGGQGLALVSAAFILARHHVQTWQLADRRSAVGFRIPLITP